jgi:putative membrane protein
MLPQPKFAPGIASIGVSSKQQATVQAPARSVVSTFEQFAALLIARADLSRSASRVAVEKADRADVREFAGYELMEAETVVAVLQDLGTPVPEMSEAASVALSGIVNAAAGSAFDTAYMSAEYENHAFLRDLAATYLRNANTSTWEPRERYGRQLAKVALFAFTEHTGIAHRILEELRA